MGLQQIHQASLTKIGGGLIFRPPRPRTGSTGALPTISIQTQGCKITKKKKIIREGLIFCCLRMESRGRSHCKYTLPQIFRRLPYSALRNKHEETSQPHIMYRKLKRLFRNKFRQTYNIIIQLGRDKQDI